MDVQLRPNDDPAPSIERLRGQDSAAFTWLVARTQKIVLGLGQSLGLNGADMDDAAAEAFLAVYQALPAFEGRAAVTTWVYAIACRALTRFRTRRDQSKTAPLGDTQRVDTGTPSAEDRYEQQETSEAIWSAVGQLDPRSAMAIELHYRRELSIEDVAKVLDCPEGTVKTLLFRARATLRDRLRKLEVTK